MNHPIQTGILIFLTGISTLMAETPYEKDLKQLKEQRDRALSTAAEPINRRYRESLDQLLRRATQGNDLDTALKIKTELGTAATIPAAAPAPPKPDGPVPDPKAAPVAIALTDLKLQIAGTKWKEAAYGGRLDFRADGSTNFGGRLGKYEAKTKDKVSLTMENKKPEILNLSRDGRHLERQKGIPAFTLEPAK